jgi:hypothetical protein
MTKHVAIAATNACGDELVDAINSLNEAFGFIRAAQIISEQIDDEDDGESLRTVLNAGLEQLEKVKDGLLKSRFAGTALAA